MPTQRLFKIEQYTEYERDELLKKWELDKLLQQRKESVMVEEEKVEIIQTDDVKTMMEPPGLRLQDSAEQDAQVKEFEVQRIPRHSFMTKRPLAQAIQKDYGNGGDIANIEPRDS